MVDSKAAASAFKTAVVSHLNQVAPVTARAMFGGYGLYCEGIMFALIAQATLYFKVDAGNQERTEVGMGPFVYHRDGKAVTMSYYQLPPAVYDDLGLLHSWVEASVAAARRGKRK
ncbi:MULTISPECIES: TfoX/Sxy family protein [Cyanophyceae]|uniref:TfoX/Sxy family protein n=1 Tax=Cyanophyceae TaxID=3028117 RepID=UPI001684AD21|nr:MULTISPECIES: TfoX/Sxy family protein [Cyanophyceae]MBD1919181.1 TfoX/Sxy family protein [Phormidium sp. FACHB-77]MBD2033174.1 TfoX/Sxy family protein [Phormidium sp. FACHB-322]MBD2054128.1 TfoX/Sxy family protein [Leptolyngbya sp. FACHB-60]